MIRVVICTCLLLASFGVLAKGNNGQLEIKVTTYSDGILLESNQTAYDLQLFIGRPDGSVSSSQHSSLNPVFVSLDAFDKGPMTDGLYKYEIVSLPLVTKTRAPDADEHDPAEMESTSDMQISRISGAFRVVQGAIVDSNEVELGQDILNEGVTK